MSICMYECMNVCILLHTHTQQACHLVNRPPAVKQSAGTPGDACGHSSVAVVAALLQLSKSCAHKHAPGARNLSSDIITPPRCDDV